MLNDINLTRLDLNLLVLFEAVLAEQHVGRAAQKLNLTPSAVSHGLTRLRRVVNDPLFLKTPRGVAPTDRANELAGPIGDVLARVRRVFALSQPFAPRTSRRRFAIGAPDGVAAILVLPLLTTLGDLAPGLDLSVRQLLPLPEETVLQRAWHNAFAELESRELDIAVVPLDEVPPRFERRCILQEDFVIAASANHPFARNPTLERFCTMRHCVVSQAGDPHGFIDQHLAKQGRVRRVAVTVPNFMLALDVVAQTNAICALPRRLVALHGARFGVVGREPPLSLPLFRLNAVTPKVAMMDAGLAWVFEQLCDAGKGKQPSNAKRCIAAGASNSAVLTPVRAKPTRCRSR